MASLPSAASRRQTHFYRIAALLALAIVLVGFGRSFYFKSFFHAPPPLTLLLVIHGAIMSVWFALFLVQAQLVSARNLRMHRRLGVAGVALRRRSDYHKRLMLLAFVGLLTAAIARAPLIGNNILLAFSTTLLLVLGCVAWDTWRNRRLHPAFGWGFALIAVSWPLRLWLSGTAGWLAFARGLIDPAG